MSETTTIHSSVNDPENRDPTGLNKHFQLDFDDVVVEPDSSAYNFPVLQNYSRRVYQYTKLFIYRLLAVVVGLPLMLFWGLIFGSYTFGMIWFAVPMRRLCQSAIHEFGIYIQIISDAMCAPFCRSSGQMFSSIRVTLFSKQTPSTMQI